MCLTDDKGCYLPPWAVDRYRLWSLCDMVQVYPASWIAAFINVEKQRWVFANLLGKKIVPNEVDKELAEFRDVLQSLIDKSGDVPLSLSMHSQIRRLSARAQETGNDIYSTTFLDTLIADADNFMRNLTMELHSYLYFAVSAEWRELYEDPQAWFGIITVETFHGIERDVRDACQCFALRQWTACVFHSMCILEIGLRALAKKLRVKMSKKPVEYAEWDEIITAIENAMAAKRLPQTAKLQPAQRRRNDWYSMMATNFRYFKMAWRNHVSHTRGDYDEEEANEVLTHVRSFMRALAAGPS